MFTVVKISVFFKLHTWNVFLSTYQILSVVKNTVTVPLKKKNTEICQQRHILTQKKTVAIETLSSIALNLKNTKKLNTP